jgi:hypothetical protein
LGCDPPKKPVNSPLPFIEPVYGAKSQLCTTADDDDLSPPATQAQALFIMKVVGIFLYYARAVDPLMFCAVSKLGSRQAKPTAALMKLVNHFLAYAYTWSDASITYYASDMKLYCYSDASYLSETHARSRAGAIYYLGRNIHDSNLPINGCIDSLSTIISTVVNAASEAEFAGQYEGGCHGTPLRSYCYDMGYPQPPTPIINDNAAAIGFANESLKQKRSRSNNMKWNWIQDQVRLNNFTVFQEAGPINKADAMTKILPPAVHTSRRPWYDSGPTIPHIPWGPQCNRCIPAPFVITRPLKPLDI